MTLHITHKCMYVCNTAACMHIVDHVIEYLKFTLVFQGM